MSTFDLIKHQQAQAEWKQASKKEGYQGKKYVEEGFCAPPIDAKRKDSSVHRRITKKAVADNEAKPAGEAFKFVDPTAK